MSQAEFQSCTLHSASYDRRLVWHSAIAKAHAAFHGHFTPLSSHSAQPLIFKRSYPPHCVPTASSATLEVPGSSAAQCAQSACKNTHTHTSALVALQQPHGAASLHRHDNNKDSQNVIFAAGSIEYIPGTSTWANLMNIKVDCNACGQKNVTVRARCASDMRTSE